MLPFEDVYRAQAARVYRFCLSQVRDRADAEDVAAEVFVSAFAAYDRAPPPADRVQAWLIRIARNATVDHVRRSRRRAVLDVVVRGSAGREELPDVETAVLARDELRFVLGRMGRLAPRDRTLVGLRVAAGLSYAEIGSVLDLSEHAATVATHRALARLRTLCEVTR